MSDDFNLNLTDVEETGSFDLMPVGDYEFVATGWENKTSAKGSAYLQITFDVTAPLIVVVRYGRLSCSKELG